ncbi:hypothetical protein [Pseudoduganella sp. OTU4001]|uniref:hypothetical protein n=1 Tax=Pseudoduganella sp. OTU4001 TaxID=3043854 RepID=UPI00313DBAF1
MDIEERMAKAETDIAVLKEMQHALIQEVRDLRSAMERGFTEERAARERQFRWMFTTLLAVLALVLGIIGRLAGIL